MGRNKPQDRDRVLPASGAAELSLRKKIAFGSLTVLSFFVALELVLAVFGVQPSRHDVDPYVGFDSYVPLFELDGATAEMRTAPSKRRFFNEQHFPKKKPPGTFRIFTLGGSTTYGRPYDNEVSFSHWMELLLNETNPGRHYEVINAGGISYASYRVVVLMRELVQYEPDLFVVYTGHNEFLEERTYRDIIDDGPVTRVLRRGASRLRTVALLQHVLGTVRERDKLPAEVKAKLDVWSGLDAFTRDDALRASVLADFRFNVRQMIEIARGHGVPILFIEPVANIKDFSPFKSEHGPTVAAERIRRFRDVYQRASRFAAGEECAHAMPLLDEALKLSPEFADVHFRIGRCELARGNWDAAGEHLLLAKELDVAPLRALEGMKEELHDLARTKGVPLVPLQALLEEDSLARYGHRFLGSEYFLDHVHPRVEIHQRIAEWIVEELVRRDIVSAETLLTKTQRNDLYKSFLETLDASYYARRDLNLGKVLGWAGKNEEATEAFERAFESMPEEPELLRDLGIVYQKQHKYELAIEKYLRLSQLRPRDAEVRFNLGKCYQGLGAWAEAAKSFEKALELEPNDGKSHYNLALTLRELGRYQEELEQLEAAWKADPHIPGIAALLGSVYAREKRYDDAIAAFEMSLEVEPDVGATHYHLGSLYATRGRRDRALEHFRRARELGIDVPDVVFEELRAVAK
jgi:tetratricopeptide (TPR) repeat protein